MRFRIALALTCLLAALAGGCGKQDDSTPVACLQGKEIYLAALAGAPGTVKLAGDTLVSECLAENQQGGDLATVGEALVETATELNGEARDVPSTPAALRLGYLIGAAQRGADSTEGIHADLIRRLTVAARYAPGREPLPPAFLAAYREGFDAGHEHG
ncbi:MAG TPA: hypothetical protein VGO13_13020 [Solirubrobacterales bacterium]|nr:hypothetical protein [Solirubrobacterales bacterium]